MNRTTRLAVSALTLLIITPPIIVGAIHTPLLRACTWALELTKED